MDPITDSQLAIWFGYQAPTADQLPKYLILDQGETVVVNGLGDLKGSKNHSAGKVNALLLEYATTIRDNCPGSQDRTSAFRHLRTARMLMNEIIFKDLPHEESFYLLLQARHAIRLARMDAKSSIATYVAPK